MPFCKFYNNTLYKQRENKRGQLEVTLLYTTSEDGLNDTVQLTVNRLRCSVQTMQEQEQYKGKLWLVEVDSTLKLIRDSFCAVYVVVDIIV